MNRAIFNPRLIVAILCFSLLMNFWPPQSSARNLRLFEGGEGGELIEAPADGTIYISLGGVGNALLASGAKIRLATANDSVLVATVISGDLIVKLQPHSSAVIKAGENLFSTSRGALFHTGLHKGKAFLDASDNLRERIPEMGNWAINIPNLGPEKAVPPVSQPVPPRLNFTASAQPIGRV